MAIVEYSIPATQTCIDQEIDMSLVNNCIVHDCKPTFVRSQAKRRKDNIMIIVRCKSEDCMRCCDGYYEKDPLGEIVRVWNRWNPKKLTHAEKHTI